MLQTFGVHQNILLLLLNKFKILKLKAIGFIPVAFFVLGFSLNAYPQRESNGFFKLSCPEKRWVIFHVFIAKRVYKISLESSEKAKELLNDKNFDGDLNGGQLDAFRHAYWMACVTQKHGWRAARSLGNSHEKGNYREFKKHRTEDGTFPDAQSGQMDFLNNDAGIQIGKDNPKANADEITDIIKNDIINGKLFILKKDRHGNFLKCNGETIKPEELKGKWETPKCVVPSNKVKN